MSLPLLKMFLESLQGFPGGSDDKESTCSAGDPGSLSGSGRSPGKRICYPLIFLGFPGGLDGKDSACNEGDLALISGLGRSPGEGNSYPFQYSCLENSIDRGAWQATVHGVTKSWTELNDFHFHYSFSVSLSKI